MKVVTFYSYKGGVGRTLAATNFAAYLAKLGLKVVIVDFDLDAPGVDSKFPDFALPSGQRGLLDCVLQFQRDGSGPDSIDDIVCPVPIASPRGDFTLGLIPAGDYIAPDYAAKLNELDWRKVFSDARDGVAFFQELLRHIRENFSADVVVIDSRTGFSEIGGLCTQQLADETVILSSLSGESIKMTHHLAQLIRESDIARALNKRVDTKIVVSRVPKPKEIDKLKAWCCKQFQAEETELFFLFSCPSLEREEFVAMLATNKEDELVANYVQLFQGLDVEVAQESIREEISRTEAGLLSGTSKEADARIREMVALFPHPEVYRRAMRFFELTRQPREALSYGLKLLNLKPDDSEAHLEVSRLALAGDPMQPSLLSRTRHGDTEGIDPQRLVAAAWRTYESGQLSVQEKVRLADILEDVRDFKKSFQVAMACLQTEELSDAELRMSAMGIAARTAMQLGLREEAANIIAEIPVNQLRGGLARVAIELKSASGDKAAAFEVAKTICASAMDRGSFLQLLELARELRRTDELEEIMQTIPYKDVLQHDPEFRWQLERVGLGHLLNEPSGRPPRRRLL